MTVQLDHRTDFCTGSTASSSSAYGDQLHEDQLLSHRTDIDLSSDSLVQSFRPTHMGPDNRTRRPAVSKKPYLWGFPIAP